MYKRIRKRPQRRPADRVFWAWLCVLWDPWKGRLFVVKPEIVSRCSEPLRCLLASVSEDPQIIQAGAVSQDSLPVTLGDQLTKRRAEFRLGPVFDEETLAQWERGNRQQRGKYLTIGEQLLGDFGAADES